MNDKDTIYRRDAIDSLRMDVDIIPFAKAREYVRAAIETIYNRLEELPPAQPERWDTCFSCPLSHGCPFIKGCTNDQAEQYAGEIPTDCPLDKESAQPERPSEIQEDILDYLDTVLHPIISPEHWNVYSELHDMISMLPSAQPRKKGTYTESNHNDEWYCWYATCNECGEKWMGSRNFCPNCGTEMDGKGADE